MDRELWERAWKAIQRVLVAVVFFCLHRGLDTVYKLAIPVQIDGLLKTAEFATFVMFILIYLYLTFDAMRILIEPLDEWLKKRGK